VNAVVPPGLILIIEQAIGHCNGNDAQTELFRITHTLPDGTVVDQYHSGAASNEELSLTNGIYNQI
jgi:hypothetical protein